MNDSEPAYQSTRASGLLAERIEQAYRRLEACTMCPRACGVDRTSRKPGRRLGVCLTGANAIVSSYCPHLGEEAPLVGKRGSGTIFFARCNLLCIFCQNFEISHLGEGTPFSPSELAQAMLSLQAMGCVNINLVSPSHVVPQILAAVDIAAESGLHVPLVYNTSGYDRPETLALLDGVVDIYMPDFKFWDPKVAEALCGAADYPEATRRALKEMHRQVGDLVLNERGVAQWGLLVRHLVLPEGLSGTREIMRFLATEISPNTYVNVMSQYRPCGRSAEVAALTRTITDEEYREAVRVAREEGITRLDEPRRVFTLRWF